MSERKKAPRTTCKKCGRDVAVRKDGSLFAHDIPGSNPNVDCKAAKVPSLHMRPLTHEGRAMLEVQALHRGDCTCITCRGEGLLCREISTLLADVVRELRAQGRTTCGVGQPADVRLAAQDALITRAEAVLGGRVP